MRYLLLGNTLGGIEMVLGKGYGLKGYGRRGRAEAGEREGEVAWGLGCYPPS